MFESDSAGGALRVFDDLNARRFGSLDAAHVYESVFGDPEVAVSLSVYIVEMNKVAIDAFRSRPVYAVLHGSPDNKTDFCRWFIDNREKMKRQCLLADSVCGLFDAGMAYYMANSSANKS